MSDLAGRLDKFVADNTRPRNKAWADKLPEEIQELLLTTHHSSGDLANWLLDEGYEGATYAKVDAWRRKHRRGS